MSTDPRPAALAACLCLAACADRATVAITDVRQLPAGTPLDMRKLSSRERLGLRPKAQPGNPHADPHGPADGMQQEKAGVRDVLGYEVPKTWSELPASSMRIVNLRVAGNPDGECYVTFLGGDGGGVKANVDRWRSQLGKGPLGQDEIDRLPRTEMFGQQAPLFVDEGDFTAFDGKKRAGFALVGTILARGSQSMTVKMTGPKSLVDAELPSFKAFVRSLRPAGEAASRRSAPESAPAAGDGLGWTAPQGWKQLDARRMRVVTFAPEGTTGTECYVALAMGSLEANLERWRGMFGLPSLSAGEIAALPSLPVLGVPSKLIDIRGTYKGSMDGKTIEDAVMLGVVCERQPQSVFVRMVGPRAEVERSRVKFEELCRSLR